MNGRELPATAFSNHGVLTRRNFMALAGAGLIGSVVPHSLRAEVAANNRRRRPNIVLIFADDLGYGDLSCYNQRAEPTPNIDSIADNGVRFTDGYVTAPMCSPSRAGLMTGRYQQRFGHEFNAGGASRSHTQGLGLPVSERTIADVLSKAGALTVMARDGAEAIAMIHGQRFDLVLSDIKMPNRNGYEVFAAAGQASHACPVILITGFGYDPNHAIVRASKEGLAGVLFKPFKVEQLIDEVHHALLEVKG